MAEERLQRRLAAILSADVVGYSRLMGSDEAGTLARLKAMRRDLFDPLIAAHSGRTFKLMGDGALVEFASAVDAVTCAIEVQKLVQERNSGRRRAAKIRLARGVRTNTSAVAFIAGELRRYGCNVRRVERVKTVVPVLTAKGTDRQIQFHLVVELPVAAEDLHLPGTRGIPGNANARRDFLTPTKIDGTADSTDRLILGRQVFPFKTYSGVNR